MLSTSPFLATHNVSPDSGVVTRGESPTEQRTTKGPGFRWTAPVSILFRTFCFLGISHQLLQDLPTLVLVPVSCVMTLLKRVLNCQSSFKEHNQTSEYWLKRARGSFQVTTRASCRCIRHQIGNAASRLAISSFNLNCLC